MRQSVEKVHRKEDQTKTLFSDSKTTEEPIGDQSIGQKTATEGVQREKSCQREDDLSASWTVVLEGVALVRTIDLDGRREACVNRCDDQAERAIAQEHG